MRNGSTFTGLLLVTALVAVVALAGCSSSQPAAPSGGSSGGSTPSGGPAKTVAVSMASFAFDPANVDVAAGGTVTWTNNDSVGHTVKIDGKVSDTIAPKGTFSKTFAAAGTFPFSCTIHPSMTGNVTVK
jgi:plastocyanin